MEPAQVIEDHFFDLVESLNVKHINNIIAQIIKKLNRFNRKTFQLF